MVEGLFTAFYSLRHLAAEAFGEGGCSMRYLATILSAIASGEGGSFSEGGCPMLSCLQSSAFSLQSNILDILAKIIYIYPNFEKLTPPQKCRNT